MELTLKVVGGSQNGKEIKVAGPKFFIGRADDCHLRPNSDAISRHHCVINIEPGNASLRDFGSRNGTFVNEERVSGECPLKNGDKLTVGTLNFEVVITANVSGKKRPPTKSIADVANRIAAGNRGADDEIGDWLSTPGAQETAVNKANEKTVSAVPDLKAISDTKADGSKATATKDTAAMQKPIELPKQTTNAADRVFGKVQTGAVTNGTKDSKEAATQMLKKIFENRNQ